MQSLEERLHAAETRLETAETKLAAAPPAAPGAPAMQGTPPSVPGTPPAGPGLGRTRFRERRASLRAVLDEYRDRLRKLNEQYGDDPTSPERQRALSELQDWFRESRLAALRGEQGGATPAEEPPSGQ